VPDSSANGDKVFGWYVSDIQDSEEKKVTFSYEPAYPDTPLPLHIWTNLGPPVKGSLQTIIKWDIGAYGHDPKTKNKWCQPSDDSGHQLLDRLALVLVHLVH
jgi:hypothetical protein